MPPTILHARLTTTHTKVAVALTDHALDRFIERVQPGCDRATATTRIAVLFDFGVIENRPPSWTTASRHAALYLTVGDVAFVLGVDARAPDRLVVPTCLVRGGHGPSGRRRNRVRRGPKLRIPLPPYRRPSPGQLSFELLAWEGR